MAFKPSSSVQGHNTTFELKFKRELHPEKYEEDEEEFLNTVYSTHEESTAATERMLGVVQGTHEIAGTIGGELRMQSEQLGQIERDMETVNDNIDHSRPLIQNATSLLSPIKNLFSGNHASEVKSKPSAGTGQIPSSPGGETPSRKGVSPNTAPKDRNKTSASASSSTPNRTFTAVLGQKGTRFDQETEKQDANLDLIGRYVADLKGVAVEIETEVNQQSEQIERITRRVDDANAKIHDANRMLRKANN